jgi:hypothetical protein
MEEPSIRELYPNLTEEELVAAEEIIDQYLAVVLRIYERLKSENAGNSPPQ